MDHRFGPLDNQGFNGVLGKIKGFHCSDDVAGCVVLWDKILSETKIAPRQCILYKRVRFGLLGLYGKICLMFTSTNNLHLTSCVPFFPLSLKA